MLCVDPQQRITIDQIKTHPAFAWGLPQNYAVPSAISAMPLTTAIPEADIDDGVVGLLRDIGYESRDVIIEDLTSNGHSIAKVFYLMYRKNSSLEMLGWPTSLANAPYEVPSEEFDTTPEGGLETEEDGDEQFKSGSTVDEGQPPLSPAEKVPWAPGMNPRHRHRKRTFRELDLPLPGIMAAAQRVLAESGYEYIHPNQLQLWVRNPCTGEYLCFDAEYENAKTISLVASVPGDGKGDKRLFKALGTALGEPLTRSESSSGDLEMDAGGFTEIA
jgi:hypothetical protein